MKKFSFLLLLLFFVGLNQLWAQSTNNEWPAEKARQWFTQKEWLNGLSITPHSSIDPVLFAKQYQLNKVAWDKAFAFLKNTDLKNLATGRLAIDGDAVYAIVTEAPTKDYEKTAFESHEKYIDLQYVISGEEAMAKTPVAAVTVSKPYNEAAGIAFYTGEGRIYNVPAGTFMLFFPGEAHRPNITPGGNKVVKKIVIKVKVAD
jgi:biofilm protein TabA